MLLIDFSFIIVFLVVGFATGILSGLFGIGGGVIFVPTLFLLLPKLGIPGSILALTVIATSLFAGSFASSSSFINHFRHKNVSLESGLYLAFGSIITAAITPKLIVNIDQNFLRCAISFFILLAALKLLFFDKPHLISKTSFNKKWLFLIGLMIGAVASVSGLGGGIFFVPVLLYYFSGDIKRAVGTSTIAVALTMISSSLSFAFLDNNIESDLLQIGYINFWTGILLGIGSIFGAIVGVKLIVKYSSSILKKIFSLFLILMAIKIMFDI
ncbi:MAG: sulfite exporter TauE/SafE family protein [Melioribacteraceae bacterium]|nr:sulfite exporter TauE/SafE family protein [Melioribacteraceae bacterium]